MSNLSAVAILSRLDERCDELAVRRNEALSAGHLQRASTAQVRLDEAQSIRSLIESMVGVTRR